MASPLVVAATRRMAAVAIAVVLAVAAGTVVLSFPHSRPNTSPVFGPGYAAATDSNVTGVRTSLTLLTAWSRPHHPLVAYFGPRGITTDDIPGARPLIGTPPSQVLGWVAASATDLTSGDRESLSWLRGYCPVSTLGGSILLFHFLSHPTAAAGPASPPRNARAR